MVPAPAVSSDASELLEPPEGLRAGNERKQNGVEPLERPAPTPPDAFIAGRPGSARTLLLMNSHASSLSVLSVSVLASTVTMSRRLPNWKMNVVSLPAIVEAGRVERAPSATALRMLQHIQQLCVGSSAFLQASTGPHRSND
uniref:Uncharacterized protein n=1 Tax=Anopheles atroparvus TaxID=41427 RepID=A0A182JMR3_ANOAO